VICRENLAELGGAIALPCQCRLECCQGCWDTTLAGSIKKGGVPTCPTCRSVIRVDYDSRSGRLIFSKVAETKIEFSDQWVSLLDQLLRKQGLSPQDASEKFALSDHRLGKTLDVDNLLREWTKVLDPRTDVSGDKPGEYAPDLKSRIERLFPLTVTFKEYFITIDNTVAESLPDVEDTFMIEDGKLLVKLSVALVGQWKDHESGIQLHPQDWIIEVNSVRGNPAELLEQLKQKELLRIRVQQSGSVLRRDMYDSANPTRIRLGEQTRPKQLELLREYGSQVATTDGEPLRLLCVCGHELDSLDLRSRVHRLVDESGTLKHGGRTFTVKDLVEMQVITCDLCGVCVEESETVWTCQAGEKTVLHAQSFDICNKCFKTYSGASEPDSPLRDATDMCESS